jgi:hypothetical protein
MPKARQHNYPFTQRLAPQGKIKKKVKKLDNGIQNSCLKTVTLILNHSLGRNDKSTRSKGLSLQ